MKTINLFFLTFSALYHPINAQLRRVATAFDGGVYAMTNELDGNNIVAYGRRNDGTLQFIGKYETGGLGGDFDGDEGLDPLISAYSVQLSEDNNYLFNVNAGSNTISVFQINKDRTLTLSDVASTGGVGPNSIAVVGNQVFVTNIERAGGDFTGEPDQEGSLVSFLFARGKLFFQSWNTRRLENRPSAVRVSPNGRSVIVSSINAGSSALASGNNDEIVLFSRSKKYILSKKPRAAATSTMVNNSSNRNLPTAIGFEIVSDGGSQYVVVTEAREFQSNGSPPAFPALQTGSVSTWEIVNDKTLRAVNLDVIPEGQTINAGQRTSCWIKFTNDKQYFWSVNAIDASISTFSFDEGNVRVTQEIAIRGTGAESPDPATAFGETQGWIDLDTDSSGQYLYQLYGLAGAIGVFQVGGGNGSLKQVEVVSDRNLPEQNTQGIVAF